MQYGLVEGSLAPTLVKSSNFFTVGKTLLLYWLGVQITPLKAARLAAETSTPGINIPVSTPTVSVPRALVQGVLHIHHVWKVFEYRESFTCSAKAC